MPDVLPLTFKSDDAPAPLCPAPAGPVFGGIEFKFAGRLLRTARPRYEWDTDITDPGAVVRAAREHAKRIDFISFAQRLPDSRPQFSQYHWEWDNVAAIPISNYSFWLTHQLHRNPRNKLHKALKQGLEVRIVPFDDTLIAAIKAIHDEVPIRQGRPYVHYHKSLAAVRAGYGTFLDRSTFIAALFRDEIIGFFKLVRTDRYARSMGLLTKNRHRDLAPMNALIAKAVELCAEQRLRYLVYGRYDYGKVGAESVADFKYYNGFEHILLPRYYVPLTARARVCLTARVHNGVIERMPRLLVQTARKWKIAYYEWRYRNAIAESFGFRPCSTSAPMPATVAE